MPNRIIKESICTSDEIDQLSAEQEVFFYRLMVVVDDFGLIDARLPILKSKCYPLKSIEISVIQANLGRLVDVGLVSLYRADGKPYLSITSWAKHQQIRAQRAKCPMPEQGIEINCNQLISDAPVIQSNPIQSESNPNPITAPEKPARFDPLKISLPECINPEAWAEWIAYRRERKLTTRQKTMQAQVDELATWAKSGHDPTSVIKTSIAKGWQGLFEPKQGNQNGNYSDFVAELTGRNRTDHAHVIDGQAERVG